MGRICKTVLASAKVVEPINTVAGNIERFPEPRKRKSQESKGGTPVIKSKAETIDKNEIKELTDN